MTHVKRGIRRILELPLLYNFFQSLIGGEKHRHEHYSKYFDLSPGSRILDLGCGTASLLRWLPDYIDYTGIDIEEKYIRWNVQNFHKRGSFYLENVIEADRKEWHSYFDAINAHGLLHHLSDQDSHILVSRAWKYLKSNGYLITVDSAYHESQHPVSRWLVSLDRGQNVKDAKGYQEVAQRVFHNVKGEIISDHLWIPFSVYVMVMVKEGQDD